MTTAEYLKQKVHLVTPLHYKLEEGYLWGLSGIDEKFVKLFYAGDEEKFSPINQRHGENLVDFYKKLGLFGHDGTDLYGKSGCGLYAVADGHITAINDPIPLGTTYNPETWGFVQMESEQNDIRFRYTYGHVSDVLVKIGQEVKANDLIALLGNTGKYTTGPHCHTMFQELDKSGAVLYQNNGYRGTLDDFGLYDNLLIYKTDDLQKLYQYAKANGNPFAYYFGFSGLARFEKVKMLLKIVGATRSQYYNYIVRKLFPQ